MDYPSLPRYVERHARERPDAVAVRAAEGVRTYGELNAGANRLARRLLELGAGPDKPVGVLLPRGLEFVTALLAVLKAGGGYLPLDPEYPLQRLRTILDRAQPVALIATRQLAARVAAPVATVYPDEEADSLLRHSAADLGIENAAGDLCYLVFTSGSTGEPKGVLVSHGNVARLFRDLGALLGAGTDDTWSQLHSQAFGFSVFEMWGALVHGGCLAVAPLAARTDPVELRRFLGDSGTTLLSLTPSAFRELLLGSAFRGGWTELAVRTVVLSGEALLPEDLRRWFAAPGESRPRLVNTYAITETGGNLLLREHAPTDAQRDFVSLGRPLPDVHVHVLRADLAPAAPGETGELYVGGPGIARGYLDDAALTAAKFVPLPDGIGRVYRTGDRVRRTAEGEIEFLGRTDDQVKWRGQRLELGEIESLLRTHPHVSAAAAAVRADVSGNEKLVAYVVPEAGEKRAAGRIGDSGRPGFWPSLGGYQVYDDFLYGLMGTDAVRIRAYGAALAGARGKVVLDLGTGAEALLARMAAQAGAARVYAVEVLPDAAAKARRAVAAAGLAGCISVLEGDAASLELPEPVDVCTQGIIGNIGSADGIAVLWNRARRHFRANLQPVPRRCTTMIAAVELPDELHDQPAFGPVAGAYVERLHRAAGREFDVRLCVRNLPPSRLLSEPRVFEDLDFTGSLPESHAGSAEFTCGRDGRFDGFLLWTVVTAADGEVIDYLAHQQAWLPVFFPLAAGSVALRTGERIAARWHWENASHPLCPDYTLDAEWGEGAQTGHSRYVTRHGETALGGTAIHRRLQATGGTPGASVAPGELRAWLARHLPESQLPNAWMYLDALPLNPNGKLDRRALPAPATKRIWGGHGGPPRTALESDLAAIWSDILGVAAVGVQDNFFDLGGDSIGAVRLTTRLQQLLDDGVMLAAIFEAPTIAALARYLGERHAAAIASRYGARRAAPASRGRRRNSRQHGEI